MANINKVALLNNGKVVGAGRNKDNSNLAPIEATTTASRSYLVGDYLMLQGEYYKVISAIAIGDTLTVGTNIQSTNVGKELKHGIVELWANSNYGSAFAGQTVTINNFNTNLYDAIIVACEGTVDEGLGARWYEIDLDVPNLSSIAMRQHAMSVSNLVQYARVISDITITSNSISLHFDDATLISKSLTNTNQGVQSTDNTRMIPVRILGLIHNS